MEILINVKGIALVFTLTVGVLGIQAVAAPQTFTGKITDNMCTKKHMIAGKSDADCARECVKLGGHYLLVNGDKVLTLSGDQKRFGDFAGQRVSVKGELKGDTLTVASLSAMK